MVKAIILAAALITPAPNAIYVQSGAVHMICFQQPGALVTHWACRPVEPTTYYCQYFGEGKPLACTQAETK